MRQFFLNILANLKAIIKDKGTLSFLVLAPLATLGFGLLSNMDNQVTASYSRDTYLVAPQISNPGPHLKTLLEEAKFGATGDDLDAALKDLKHMKLLSVYEVPADFEEQINRGQKPEIKLHKVDEGNITVMQEQKVESIINTMLRKQQLAAYTQNPLDLSGDYIGTEVIPPTNTTAGEDIAPLLMLFYFMSMITMPIAADLLKKRKERIFYRLMGTANSGAFIMTSHFGAYAILQVIFYSLGYLIMHYGFHMAKTNVPITLTYIILMSLLNIAMAICVSRWIKNESLVGSFAALINIIFFFTYLGSIIGLENQTLVRIFKGINLFSPFYWSMTGIEKQVIFPHVPIIILIILVLLTLGSWRMREFAKE